MTRGAFLIAYDTQQQQKYPWASVQNKRAELLPQCGVVTGALSFNRMSRSVLASENTCPWSLAKAARPSSLQRNGK
ncbi:hypothetical protein [Methylocapsa palsarum]|uniref:Uncharacterized protein n=1 Tax=Methylocapsa palsarum TaxID=1612308 RepID=A0A1I4CLS2_9HYPH|nr:hypothetical protein [Methylocapsa palsarum]SFK81016.1 hypothetical protein SAMN05444581_12318 [Methylocapsa palsarum]